MTFQCARIMQVNLVNVSFLTSINKSLEMFLDTNLTLKVLCNAYMLLLMDNSVDNSNYNMGKLSRDPRKELIILHNNCVGKPTELSH